MKKVLFAVVVATLLMGCSSCGNRAKKVVDEVSSEILEQVVGYDGHNAKNSLDYQGTYKGVLPSDNQAGKEVTIELGQNSYVKRTLYVGQQPSDVVLEKGEYSWNERGNVITLEGVLAPNKYFVGENNLTELDKEGKKFAEELAVKYKLTKVE